MYLKSKANKKDKNKTVALVCLSILSTILFLALCGQTFYIYMTGGYDFNLPFKRSGSIDDKEFTESSTTVSSIETMSSGNPECDANPMLFKSYSTNAHDSTLDGKFFAYISMSSGMYTVPNSVIIYDENANLIRCINAIDFVKQSNIPMEKSYVQIVEGSYNSTYGVPSFWAVKKVDEDTLVINVNLRIDFGNLYMYLNNWVWIFTDYNFKPKPEYSPLSFKLNPDSKVFGIDTYTEPHDILMLGNDLALYSVAEHRELYDVKRYVPDATADVIILVAEGFRIVKIRTGEEVAAVSGYDLFLDKDRLIDYIVYEKYFAFKKTKDYKLFDINHFNSIVEVPGEHWDESLIGKRTFLVNHREIDTTDLMMWNFEKGEGPKLLWRLPGLYAPIPIREDWADKWNITGDPLYYMSHAHDLNVENVEAGNFVALDNGHLHKVDNGNGGMCSMTRIVEYKVSYNPDVVEYDTEARHKLELVFSFPPVEKYPKVYGLDDSPKSNNTLDWKQSCTDFWNYEKSGFWFSVHMGSARKQANGNYIFTKFGADHYPYQLDIECHDHGSIMEIDNKGDIIKYYQASVRGGITYRLTTFENEDFASKPNFNLKSSFKRTKIT